MNLFGNNDKNYLEEFNNDKESLSPPFRPIDRDKTDPALAAFDDLHGYASKLSGKNQNKYKWTLRLLTIVGTAIAITFLIYDELEFHWLSAVFLALLGLLIILHIYGVMIDCHRKYVEYRILAEATRIQYYLSVRGMQKPVFEIMPWFLQNAVKWIEDPLSQLPLDEVVERKPIIDCWIIDQKNYHARKLNETKKESKRYSRWNMVLIGTTIFLYIFAFFYDFGILNLSSAIPLSPDTAHIVLKVAIGAISVGSLLIVSYFGKLSLSEKIDNHSQMKELYKLAEKEIRTKGETPELIERLAREFLIENSAWYSYQIRNKLELVL